ncbi:MAG TPA: metallopeptidase family protein [Longimicrobiaceae bacterium]|nr:metallopeptidase family protein [Longimicrobiaceae bacterium]
MTFAEFERRAHEVFDEIPPEYREGVDGLLVERRAVAHPELPEVYTLGECLTETYPTEWGGAGEVRSMVVLYYGSFLRLSRMQDDWDWDEEVWETVTHEVRHHLESLALDDELEVRDYADDQNFARREGVEFEPFFFRSGEPAGPGAWEVSGDVFLECEVSAEQVRAGTPVELEWDGKPISLPLPSPLGDVHFVTLDDVHAPKGDVIVVLVRRRGAWESFRAALSGRKPEVLESLVRVAADEGGEDEPDASR